MSANPRTVLKLALATVLIASTWNVLHHLVARHYADDKADLKKAIEWNPDEPEYHFRRGLAKRDLPGDQTLADAEESLIEATRLNPFFWQHWIELAHCYELEGKRDEAEKAFQKALALNPRSGEYHWRFANFHLRWGDREDALRFFESALRWDLALRESSLQLLVRSGYSPQEIRSVWPHDPDSRRYLLSYFLNERSADSDRPLFLARCWEELLNAETPPTIEQGASYIQYLLQDRPETAREQWIQLARRNGLIDADYINGKNLIWNGHFEERISGGPLDWHVGSAGNSSISQVAGEGVDGSTALRVDFTGGSNPNFRALVLQFLTGPANSLTFSFSARCQDITSDEGLYFQLIENATGRVLVESERMQGTTSWTQYVQRFAPPAETVLTRLVFRRNPSFKIDNQLSGTVWIDSVEIEAL